MTTETPLARLHRALKSGDRAEMAAAARALNASLEDESAEGDATELTPEEQRIAEAADMFLAREQYSETAALAKMDLLAKGLIREDDIQHITDAEALAAAGFVPPDPGFYTGADDFDANAAAAAKTVEPWTAEAAAERQASQFEAAHTRRIAHYSGEEGGAS